MILKKTLLRWYKSFNEDWRPDPKLRKGEEIHPWNVNEILGPVDEKFRFIEIPIENDITTVVGSNESGKSQLLNSIRLVLDGKDVKGYEYCQSALCAYSRAQTQNTNVWPQVGLQFEVRRQELQAIMEEVSKVPYLEKTEEPDGGKKEITEEDDVNDATEANDIAYRKFHSLINPINAKDTNDDKESEPEVSSPKIEKEETYSLTLILAPDENARKAVLFVNLLDLPVSLNQDALEMLRERMPSVHVIKFNAFLNDELPLKDILGGGDRKYFREDALREAHSLLHTMNLKTGVKIVDEDVKKWNEIKSTLEKGEITDTYELEDKLFGDLLGITPKTVDFLVKRSARERTFVKRSMDIWTTLIEKNLNMSRYWQQDDNFKINVDSKKSELFFEISDKSKSKFMFSDRSDGLRYFVSCYLQALAIKKSNIEKGAIV